MADFQTIFLFQDYVVTQLGAQPQSVSSNEIIISGLDDTVVIVFQDGFLYVDDVFWGNIVSIQNGDRLRLEVNHQLINQPVSYEVLILERSSGFIFNVSDSFSWNVEINDPSTNVPSVVSSQSSTDENIRISDILTSIVASSLSESVTSNKSSATSFLNEIEPELLLEVLQKAGFIETNTSGETDLSSLSQVFDSFREIINDTSRNIVEDILTDDTLIQQFATDSEETLLSNIESTSEKLRDSFTTRLNEIFSEVTDITQLQTTDTEETQDTTETQTTDTDETQDTASVQTTDTDETQDTASVQTTDTDETQDTSEIDSTTTAEESSIISETAQINVSELVEEKTQTLTETKEVLQSIQQSVGESSDDADLSQQAFADFLETTEISDKVLGELSELIDLQDPKPINELIENLEQSIQTFQDLQEIEQSNPQVFADIQEALGINVDPQFDETLDIIQENTQLFDELDDLIQTNVQIFQSTTESDSLSTIQSVGLSTIDEIINRLQTEETEIITLLRQQVADFIEQALIKTLISAEDELLVDALQRLFGEEQESFDLETLRRTEVTAVSYTHLRAHET